jgi:hypothetical protein
MKGKIIETSAASAMSATGVRSIERILLGSDVLPGESLRDPLLQAVFAWNALDYMLRIVLKRLRGWGIDEPRTVEIMTSRNHSQIMKDIRDELRRCGDTRLQQIDPLLKRIGTRKDVDSMYDRRNHAIHSVFAYTQDGGEIFRRIGHGDYKLPSQVTPQFLRNLAKDIGEAIDSLNRIVPPKTHSINS